MARSKKVDEALARKAKSEMRNIIDHVVCFRLQAIVSCVHHPVIVVGSIMGVHRATIWRWITRFQEGVLKRCGTGRKGTIRRNLMMSRRGVLFNGLLIVKMPCDVF